MFRLCARHSILNISPYYLKADFIFPLSCDSKNSCPDTTRKGLNSLEDVDTTAGHLKKNIYFSLRIHNLVPYQTIHIEHQHTIGDAASYINFLNIHELWAMLKWTSPWLLPLLPWFYGCRSPTYLSSTVGRYLRSQHQHSSQQKLIASGVFFPMKAP